MRRIKDGAPPEARAGAAGGGAAERARRLLEERARAVERLAAIDRALLELAGADAGGSGEDEVEFWLRGEDVAAGRFAPPPGVDRSDLEVCLSKVVLAMRRRGDEPEAREVRVLLDPATGRVREVAWRRVAGDAWRVELRRAVDRAHPRDEPGCA